MGFLGKVFGIKQPRSAGEYHESTPARPQLSEGDASVAFVRAMLEGAAESWPVAIDDLNSLRKHGFGFPDKTDEMAKFEFALACLALQMQAIPNLLPTEQALRIKDYIFQTLSSTDNGSYMNDTLAQYQVAWDEVLAQSGNPVEGLAYALYRKWGCKNSVDVGREELPSPIALMAIGVAVAEVTKGWWKHFLEDEPRVLLTL